MEDQRPLTRIAHVDGDDPPEKEVVVSGGVGALELALYRRQRALRERGARLAVPPAQRAEGGGAAGALGGGEEPAQALLVGGEEVYGVVALFPYAPVEPGILVDADEKEQRVQGDGEHRVRRHTLGPLAVPGSDDRDPSREEAHRLAQSFGSSLAGLPAVLFQVLLSVSRQFRLFRGGGRAREWLVRYYARGFSTRRSLTRSSSGHQRSTVSRSEPYQRLPTPP